MFAIIRDTAKLNESISRQIAVGGDYYKLLHINAVSALVHTAIHGQVAVLNRFYGSLKVNEQTAFKLYVRRIQTALDAKGFAVKDAEGNNVASDMEFLRFEDKAFAIIKDRTKERDTFVKHAEGVLINPDGDTVKAFFDRDSIKEIRTLGDNEFAKRIAALQKLATEPAGNNTSAASKKMLAIIERAATEAAKLMEANKVHDDDKGGSFDVTGMIYNEAKTKEPVGLAKLN